MSRQYDAKQQVLKAYPADRQSGVDMFLGYVGVSEADFAYEEGMSSEEYIYGKDDQPKETPSPLNRKYSVSQIDDLRRVIRSREIFGSSNPQKWPPHGKSYKEADLSSIVECQVQTAILAGHTAQDFIDADSSTLVHQISQGNQGSYEQVD